MSDSPLGQQGHSMQQESVVKVNFPFAMVLQHEKLDFAQMFSLTEAFDLYEVMEDPTGEYGMIKEAFVVDVMEVTQTETTLKLTPAQPLSYKQLAKYTQSMLDMISKGNMKTKPKVAMLRWEIAKTGVSSDIRGQLRTVQ